VGGSAFSVAFLADNKLMAQSENFRLKVFRVVAEHLSFHKAADSRVNKTVEYRQNM
jgi:hypothetical protein